MKNLRTAKKTIKIVKFSKSIAIFSILILTLMFAAACTGGDEGRNDAGRTVGPEGEIQAENGQEYARLELTFLTLPALEAFPVFIADSFGFFEDEGLHVTIERFFNPRDRDVAFQTNENIDGMVFDLVQLAIYREAGIDIVATTSTVGMASLIGGPGVYGIMDLAGGNVLMTSNTSMDYILDRALDSVGLAMGDIITAEVPALPTRLEMLLHNQAAGAVLPDPFAAMALEEGFNLLTTTRELGINPFIFAFRRGVVENKTTEMQAFYRAVNRAVDFLNTADREEFIDILVETVGYPAHVRDTLVVPLFPAHSIPVYEVVRDVLDFTYSRGLAGSGVSVEDVIFDIGNF